MTTQQSIEQRLSDLWQLVQEARVTYSGQHASGTFRTVGEKIEKIQDALSQSQSAQAGGGEVVVGEVNARGGIAWYSRAIPSTGTKVCIAAPASPAAAAVPEGFVLVPVEPTLEMCNAAWRDLEQQGIEPEDVETAQIWRAMLAAAQKDGA